MTLKIINGNIYDNDDVWLKKISCPKAVRSGDMKKLSVTKLLCDQCNHTVHNTDFMSEDEISALLKNNPHACLKISVFNPIFEVKA